MGQGVELLGSVSIGFAVQSQHKVDDIASGIAFGKAIPEVFGKADHKGSWVVAAMHGAGAKKLIPSFFEVRAQALGVQYRLNGNDAFEICKTQKVREHCWGDFYQIYLCSLVLADCDVGEYLCSPNRLMFL